MKKNEFKLRNYEDGDYEFVYDAKKFGYKEYVELYYGKWDDDVQHDMFKNYLSSRKEFIKIIEVHGEKAGFIDVSDTDDCVLEIGNICLMPNFRGKGIGSNYFEKLLTERENQTMRLRVFKNNPAQNLYKRFGFEITQETDTHFYMERKKG